MLQEVAVARCVFRDAMEVMDVDGAARRPVELARLLLPCLRWVRAAGKNCLGVSQLDQLRRKSSDSILLCKLFF